MSGFAEAEFVLLAARRSYYRSSTTIGLVVLHLENSEMIKGGNPHSCAAKRNSQAAPPIGEVIAMGDVLV